MNRKRLQMVIAANENPRIKKFDLSVFADNAQCPTAGCAIGNFCVAHPKAGLRIHESIYGMGTALRDAKGNYVYWTHIGAYFGINVGAAQFLFSMYAYPRRKRHRVHVIERLKKFLKDGIFSNRQYFAGN